MNTKGNLALAVLAGISIGAVSVMAVHARSNFYCSGILGSRMYDERRASW
jgi:hypothetical protein